MAPRRTPVIDPERSEDEPFREAMRVDNENVAEQFAAAVSEFEGVSDGSVRGHLYKVERNGKYQWIGEYWPPFDQADIYREMRELYKGGDYQLRILVTGKRGIQKAIPFSVAPAPNMPISPARDNSTDLVPVMMQMMQSGSDRQMQMMMAMMQQAQQSQAQQTQMMVAMVSGMMGSQAKPTDLLPLIAAMKPEDKGGGMKEAIETLAAAKGLFGDGGSGGGGFDADDLVGSAIKLAGPVVGAIGRAVGQRQAPQEMPAEMYAQPQGPLLLPGAETPAGPAASDPYPPRSRFPILDLVRDDVLFFYSRAYDPQLAAEAIYDRIEALGVSEDGINDMVAAFIGSADPWDELAGAGLDLRVNSQWTSDFFAALIAIHSDAGRDDDTGGSAGGGTDPRDDGETGA